MENCQITNSWVTCPQQQQAAEVRLFCFPHAGGASLAFDGWARELPGVDVCPVELPGRGRRFAESPFTNMRQLVRTLVKRFSYDMPFSLFGHSMGALVAFELARELRRSGYHAPRHLFVSACTAPRIIRHRNPPRHLLSDDELKRELQLLSGTPKQLLQDSSVMQIFLPALRADFALMESYRYSVEAPLQCPITAFGGEQDSYTALHELLLWKEETRSAFAIRMFPGGHFFLKEARKRVLAEISNGLGQECVTPW